MYKKQKLVVYVKKSCLFDQWISVVVLNDVTWSIRNIVPNPRSVGSSRTISNQSLFSTKFKFYV